MCWILLGVSYLQSHVLEGSVGLEILKIRDKNKNEFHNFKIFLKFRVLIIDTSLIFFLKKLKLKIKYNYFATKNMIIGRQLKYFFKEKIKNKN